MAKRDNLKHDILLIIIALLFFLFATGLAGPEVPDSPILIPI